jgi:hypothetical protein
MIHIAHNHYICSFSHHRVSLILLLSFVVLSIKSRRSQPKMTMTAIIQLFFKLLIVTWMIAFIESKPCGLLGLGLFCPRSGKCGFFRRLLRLCPAAITTVAPIVPPINPPITPPLESPSTPSTPSTPSAPLLPSPSMKPPTPMNITTLAPTKQPSRAPISSLQVACEFLNVPNVSTCQLQTMFNSSKIGTIPTEIGLLTQTTFLQLATMQLVGTIPSTIGNLYQLALEW